VPKVTESKPCLDKETYSELTAEKNVKGVKVLKPRTKQRRIKRPSIGEFDVELVFRRCINLYQRGSDVRTGSSVSTRWTDGDC
jgi:hypothetical protein